MDELEAAGGVVGAHDDADVADIAAAAAAGEEHEVAYAEVLAVYAHSFSVLMARTRADGIAELLVDIA